MDRWSSPALAFCALALQGCFLAPWEAEDEQPAELASIVFTSPAADQRVDQYHSSYPISWRGSSDMTGYEVRVFRSRDCQGSSTSLPFTNGTGQTVNLETGNNSVQVSANGVSVCSPNLVLAGAQRLTNFNLATVGPATLSSGTDPHRIVEAGARVLIPVQGLSGAGQFDLRSVDAAGTSSFSLGLYGYILDSQWDGGIMVNGRYYFVANINDSGGTRADLISIDGISPPHTHSTVCASSVSPQCQVGDLQWVDGKIWIPVSEQLVPRILTAEGNNLGDSTFSTTALTPGRVASETAVTGSVDVGSTEGGAGLKDWEKIYATGAELNNRPVYSLQKYVSGLGSTWAWLWYANGRWTTATGGNYGFVDQPIYLGPTAAGLAFAANVRITAVGDSSEKQLWLLGSIGLNQRTSKTSFGMTDFVLSPGEGFASAKGSVVFAGGHSVFPMAHTVDAAGDAVACGSTNEAPMLVRSFVSLGDEVAFIGKDALSTPRLWSCDAQARLSLLETPPASFMIGALKGALSFADRLLFNINGYVWNFDRSSRFSPFTNLQASPIFADTEVATAQHKEGAFMWLTGTQGPDLWAIYP